jgi:hypothetical protein
MTLTSFSPTSGYPGLDLYLYVYLVRAVQNGVPCLEHANSSWPDAVMGLGPEDALPSKRSQRLYYRPPPPSATRPTLRRTSRPRRRPCPQPHRRASGQQKAPRGSSTIGLPGASQLYDPPGRAFSLDYASSRVSHPCHRITGSIAKAPAGSAHHPKEAFGPTAASSANDR